MIAANKSARFLLHKVGKYWYVSQQLPFDNKGGKEYRHKHFGRIKFKNMDMSKDKSILDPCSETKFHDSVFEPFMDVFSISKQKLQELNVFINETFKNIKWTIPFNIIKNGVEINESKKETTTKTTKKVKEKIYA